MNKFFAGIAGAGWFAPALPWILLAIVGAMSGLGFWVYSLKADTLHCESSLSAGKAEYAEHLQADANAVADALLQRAREEDQARAREAKRQAEWKEIRDGLEAKNVALEQRLGPSGDLRVRRALCPASADRGGLNAAAGASPAASEGQQAAMAAAVRDIAGRTRARDADYAELLTVAEDRIATCNGSSQAQLRDRLNKAP